MYLFFKANKLEKFKVNKIKTGQRFESFFFSFTFLGHLIKGEYFKVFNIIFLNVFFLRYAIKND